MDYLIKASGIVILFFLFYEILLKKETFFTSIRAYFLIGLLLTILIPIIEIPIYVETVATQLSNLKLQEITLTEPIKQSFDWLQLFTNLYLIGVVLFSIKFFIQLISLLFFISKNKLKKNGNYYFIETSKNCSPFSFFNIIIFNKSQFSEEELFQIITHEKAHVVQWHSVDTILTHLMVVLLWFNPFVWLYKKAVLQNLEFIADAYAIKLANNQKLYQLTLLKTCSGNYCTEITNNFYNSLIKKRIIMLHKSKSTNKNQFKYLLLIPILIGFIMTFNTKIIAQEISWVQENNYTIDLVIDKNSTDAILEQESSTFKEKLNVNLSFKGVKRNSNNEIIAIKITAKGENVKANFENSGAAPIKPIKISFDSKSNAITIGNLNEEHLTTIYQGENVVSSNNKPTQEAQYVFITSDGEKTTWTSKNTDSISKENKIIINDANVWVTKNDNEIKVTYTNDENNKQIVKIIKNGEEIIIDEKVEDQMLFIESDDASENVIIFENENGKIEKEKKVIVVNSGNINVKPLYILDGKEISPQEMEKINPDTIESVNVLKGENAITNYGEKGKNGVIVIKLKKQ